MMVDGADWGFVVRYKRAKGSRDMIARALSLNTNQINRYFRVSSQLHTRAIPSTANAVQACLTSLKSPHLGIA